MVASEQTSWKRRFGDEPGFSAMPSGPLNQYWKVMSASGMLCLEPTFAILPQHRTLHVASVSAQEQSVALGDLDIVMVQVDMFEQTACRC